MLDDDALRLREKFEKHVWAIRLRAMTLLGVTFVYAYLAATGRVPLNLFAVVLIAGLFAFNAARRGKVSRSFSRFMIGIDIVLITIAVWATGGVATFLLPCYFVQVVATSLHTNPRQGVVSALNAWALFAGVALLELTRVLPHGPLSPSPLTARLAADSGFVEAQILSLFVLLGAVTYSAGFIAQHLRVRERELEVAHDELEILYRAAERFLRAETPASLAAELCRASERLGANAAAVFIEGDRGPVPLASLPAELPEALSGEFLRRAGIWLNSASAEAARLELQSEREFGLLPFRLGTGVRGVHMVRGSIDQLVGQSAEGLSLLVQQFSWALTNLENLQETSRLATTDPLTGACNRRRFDQVFAEELARAARYARPLALILVDIDHFKKLNDTCGHQEGDRVLKGAVAAMRRALRSHDTLARYGGEEFAVIAPETGPKQAMLLAERLRTAIESWDYWPGVEGRPPVTASLGVASRLPTGEATSVTDLIQRADAALYAAKRGGRNRTEAYRPEHDAGAAAAHPG